MLAAVNGVDTHSPTSADPPTTGSPVALSLKEIGKSPREWTLTVHPEHLALAESPGAQPYVILRDEVMKSATLLEGMNVFALTKPVKVNFKLAPEATARLADWIGKPVLAAHYLKRRYAWVLPVAIIWMLGSLPTPSSPALGSEATRFDPVGFGLGLILVLSWAFAKWRPHPALFLVDSVWFLCLAGYLAAAVLHGRSRAWVLLMALALWMVFTGLRHFARFRGVSLRRPSPPTR